MSTFHRVFGLNVESEIAMPEAAPWDAGEPSLPDVTVRCGTPSYCLEDIREGADTSDSTWRFYRTSPKHLIFSTPVANFEVREGREMVVQPYEGVCEGDVRVFVLGSGFGVLQMQRGRLPIHGSAVEIDGRAMVIVGNSGAGKSTATAALVQRGVRYLTDDVAAATVDGNMAWIAPAYPQRKLCLDACRMLGVQTEGLPVVSIERQKVAIRNPAEWCDRPLPLGWIVELVPDESCAAPTVCRVTGGEGLQLLLNNLYRKAMLELLGISPERMRQLLAIASSARVYRVRRPASPAGLGALADALAGIADEK